MKVLSAYEQRIEDALVAEDKRLKEEEELKKSEEEMKKGGGKKKRLLKGEEEKKGVRSEQPLEDETNQPYMHEDPEEDGVLRPYLAWRYAIKQTNNEGKVRYLPAPDNERAYPLLNCELHGRHIWLHQAQGHVKPQASTTVTQAFGNFMYSKMVRTLRDEDLIVRQKSITWVVELLCVPENRARCLAAGFLPILASMLSEEDMYFRQQLALCFKFCAAAITTWIDLCELGCIKGLLAMVADENAILRRNALDALNDAALSCEVRSELVNDGTALTFIMNRIKEDKDTHCLCNALDLLSKCVAGLNYDQKALTELLKANAVAIVLKLANTPYQDLMVSVARFLCLLCFDEAGRKKAVELKAVEVLVPYLNHVDSHVIAYAAAALISITLEVQGKKDFIMANGVPVLVPMLNLSDTELTFMVMVLITNVAEHPHARMKLQRGIEVLRAMVKASVSATIKKCSRQTIQQLQFRSRPFQNLKDVR